MKDLIHWYEQSKVLEGLEQAKRKQLPLFVDLFAPGCKGCEKLEATTYQDSQVATLINEQFVPILYDATRQDENFEAVAGPFAHTFSPVLIMRTPEGKELRHSVGYLSPEEMLLELHLGQALFAMHKRDWTTAYSLLNTATDRYQEGKQVAEALWWRGVAAYRKSGNNLDTLAREWQVLMERFPQTLWADKANVLSIGCAC